MFVIAPEVRLDPQTTNLTFDEWDWAINPEGETMKHLPSDTLYQIRVDAKEDEASPLFPMDFSARLIAIGPGCALPSPANREALARQSIALYLRATGYLHPYPEAEGAAAQGRANPYVC